MAKVLFIDAAMEQADMLGGNGYTCGATGEACRHHKRKDGTFPCDECKVGVAFREAWKGQPTLTDD